MQSLHNHTTTSDGQLDYQEVLTLCGSLGMNWIAFTDHDAVPSSVKVDDLRKLREHPVKWVMGIEISSGLPQELGGGPASGFHVVGLGVDPTNSELVDHCQKAQEARIIRMQQMVFNLKSLGFRITDKDCYQASNGESVGRPHIVRALSNYPENNIVLNHLVERMRVEGQNNLEVRKQYDYMLERGETQFPYALFLSEDAYFPGIFVEYQYWLDFDQTVNLIHQAGGIAIIAHYCLVQNKISYELLEKIVSTKRIDGLETIFGYFGYKTPLETGIEADRQCCRDLVQKYNLVASGGADAHKKEDFIEYTNASWYQKESVGMFEKIQERYPDLITNKNFP